MMGPEALKQYVKAQPFRPFQIQMASGATYEIRHPEMVRLGRADLVLFTPTKEDPEIYDHWNTLSLMLIERVSQLTTPALGS